MQLRILVSVLLLFLAYAPPSLAADACANPTIEVHCDHPEIVAKATELATPLEMFRFVRNTIGFQVYYGSKKGALGTLRSGRGNDFDQASLLIALLRAAGYEARYGLAVANVDRDQLSAWSGIEDPELAQAFFHKMYCLVAGTGPCDTDPPRFSVVDLGNDESTVYMERAWVEVRLSANYRGLSVDNSDLTWVPLDPAWKDRSLPETPAEELPPLGDEITGDCQDKLCFDYQEYWSEVNPRLVTDIWERQIQEWLAENHPGRHISDIVHDGPVVPYEADVLPAALPFFPEPQHPEENGLPATPSPVHVFDLDEASEGGLVNRRFTMTLRMAHRNTGPFFLATFETPSVVGRRLTISFPPRHPEEFLRNGGWLGGWTGSSAFNSLAEYCLAHPEQNQCRTEVALRLDGVEVARIANPDTPVGSSDSYTGWDLVFDIEKTPGGGPGQWATFTRENVTVGETIAIVPDLDDSGPNAIQQDLDRFLRIRERFLIVDEGEGEDPNGNGIPGEVLLDQGSSGIQSSCDYADPDAMTECDIAIAAQLEAADELVGELIHMAGRAFHEQRNEELRRLDRLDRLVTGRYPSATFPRSGLHFEYLFDDPVGVAPGNPILDAVMTPAVVTTVGASTLEQRAAYAHRTGRRGIHVISALEHRVWERLLGREFVSTVKGIQMLREQYPSHSVFVATAATWEDPDHDHREAFKFGRFEGCGDEVAPTTTLDVTIAPIATIRFPRKVSPWFTEKRSGLNGATEFHALVCVSGLIYGGVGLIDPDPTQPFPELPPMDSRFDDWSLGEWTYPDSVRNELWLSSILAGDPVSMLSGNLEHSEVDFKIPGDGPHFELARTYHSRLQEEGTLGHGWTHSYEASVGPVRDENFFLYPPSEQEGFRRSDRIEGVLSDTPSTFGQGNDRIEVVRWDALPQAFRDQVIVESIELELGYSGNPEFESGDPTLVADPVSTRRTRQAGGKQFETIKLLTPSGENYTDISQSFELRIDKLGELEALYFARLRITYEGPLIEHQSLEPVTPLIDWEDGAQLLDEDPSTCTLPSTPTEIASVSFEPSPDLGGFGYEIRAAVSEDDDNGNPAGALTRGDGSGTVETFNVGPDQAYGSVLGPGYQLRLVSVRDVAGATSLTFDADRLTNKSGNGSSLLCHLDLRRLIMPEQVDVAVGDGTSRRFSKIPDGEGGFKWEADTGVRERLTQDASGFVLTRADGSVLEFQQDAGEKTLLTAVRDAQGRSLIVSYDENDRIDTVAEDGEIELADGTGLVPALEFSYSASGYLEEVRDWTGRAWSYTVDGSGHLIEAKDPIATAEGRPGMRYEYGLPDNSENEDLVHNLTRVIFPKDADGVPGGDRWIAFEYFQNDRVASHTDSLGNTQRFIYNIASLASETIDPRGNLTSYRYDEDGNLTQRRDPGGSIWDWEFDEDRQVIKEIDPLGHRREFLYATDSGDPCDPVERGNPCEIIGKDGRSRHLTYESLSGQVAEEIDVRGNLFTRTFTNGLLAERRATVDGVANTLLEKRIYDPASHRLDAVIRPLEPGTPRKAVSRFFYLPGNRDVHRVEQWEDTDGDEVVGEPGDLLLTASDFTHDALGRLVERRTQRRLDPEGTEFFELVETTSYDARDQVKRIVRPDGTALVMDHDGNGNVSNSYLEETLPRRASDGSGLVVEHQHVDFEYDAMDRVVAETNAAGHTWAYEYDASGNRVAMTNPLGHTSRVEYDAMGQRARTIDANGSVSIAEYDLMGRVVRELDATGVAATRAYDETGRLVGVAQGGGAPATRTPVYEGTAYREQLLDPNGNLTVFEFDELGRVFKITDAEGGVWRMDRDFTGNLIELEDATGAVSTFGFDALARQTTEQYAWTAAAKVTKFDESGNPLQITRPDGCNLRQWFDRLDRVTRRVSDEETCDGEVDERFGYDARGNLVAARNPHVGLIRRYDQLNRLVRETDDRFGTSVRYLYDEADQLQAKVYPDGSLLHVSYDPAGRAVGIRDPFGDLTRYVYDPAGRRLETSVAGSGVVTRLGYDGRGRLASIDSTRAAGTVARERSYPLYDEAGNRRQMVDEAGGVTDYSYDGLHRLILEAPSGQDPTHYSYDGAGNRLRDGRKQGASWTEYRDFGYSLTASRHRLEEVRDESGTLLESFGYDDNGQVTSWAGTGIGSRTLTWNALGQLVAIEGSFSAEYVYDPMGRRIEKTEEGVTTRYQYDGLDAIAEYDETAQQATYVFGPGIDEPIRVERDGELSEIHTDGLGSVLLLSNAGDGTDTASYSYSAFGEAESTTGAASNAYTFTGRERDASGLYYYRARYYLASVGRFVSPDPIGYAGGMNPYAYVDSNPVNFRDPFGLSAFGGIDNFSVPNSPSHFQLGYGADSGPFADLSDFGFGHESQSESLRDVIVAGTRNKADRLLGFIDAATFGGTTATFAGIGNKWHRLEQLFDVGIDCGVANCGTVPLIFGPGRLIGSAGRGSSFGRFFYDPRSFSRISREYWATNGPAAGRSLHHWLIPQRATWVPAGVRNAGFNLLELPALRGVFHPSLSLNTWMGFARNWGAASAREAALVERTLRLGVPAAAGAAGYAGYELGSAWGGR